MTRSAALPVGRHATRSTSRYHDTEWGVPIRDPHRLFELLCLEGAQAGLAWITILRKREGYRAAFDGFDVERMAAYTDADRARLLADAGIVRNRAKVAMPSSATRGPGSSVEDPVELIWSFVDGAPVREPMAGDGRGPRRDRCITRDVDARCAGSASVRRARPSATRSCSPPVS